MHLPNEVRPEQPPTAKAKAPIQCSGFWGDVAVLFICAVGLRLIYIFQTDGVPFQRFLVGDARGYYEWAARIASGAWLGERPFYQAPLYPYVLALIRTFLSQEVWAIRLVQAFWGSLAGVCLYMASRRLFSRRVGLIAGMLWACYPPAIFFDGIVQKASLAGALTCGLVLLIVNIGIRFTVMRVAVLGVVAGLLVLVRENVAVWLVLLGIAVANVRRELLPRGRLRALAVFALGALLVLIPVGLRNWMVGGEWSLSTFQLGPNFYIGNGPQADGYYHPLIRGRETPKFERTDATELAEKASGGPMSARQVSRYWQHQALKAIEADPWHWLALMGRKLLMVCNRYEVADVESARVYEQHSAWLGLADCLWHFGALAVLAAIGVAATWDLRRQLWLVYAMIVTMALAIALFFVLARYRFVLVPLLIPLAAAGIDEIMQLVKQHNWPRLLRRCAVGLGAALLTNWPIHDESRLDALAFMNAGVALAEAGELGEAQGYLLMAVDECPNSAEAQNNLAQAFGLQGLFAEAIPHYRAALALEPALSGVEYNLAVALEHTGSAQEALQHYQQALSLNPDDRDAAEAVKRLRLLP